MKLYEATNGYTGSSYLRCYVWANNEEEAQELAVESYKNAREAKWQSESYWSDIELRLMVDADKDIEPFYTEPED
jgi:hypothetical protein